MLRLTYVVLELHHIVWKILAPRMRKLVSIIKAVIDLISWEICIICLLSSRVYAGCVCVCICESTFCTLPT
jgi:hypothetical protein